MRGGDVVYLQPTWASVRDEAQTVKVYNYQKEVHVCLNIPPVC